MNEQLYAIAVEVVKYRISLARDKAHLSDLQQTFNAEHAPLIEHLQKLNLAVQGAEADLRKATITAYLADPDHDKQVAPGIATIREMQVIGYDPGKALAWAKEHGLALLLDTKTYEALVKAGQAPGSVVVEPQAAIARDIKLPKLEAQTGEIA